MDLDKGSAADIVPGIDQNAAADERPISSLSCFIITDKKNKLKKTLNLTTNCFIFDFHDGFFPFPFNSLLNKSRNVAGFMLRAGLHAHI